MSNPTPTVCVIDDDPSVRKSLSLLLSSAGFGVRTFSSAREFLNSTPDRQGSCCLVLDVRMPGFTGLELQEELISRNLAVPIIFITGHGDIPMSVRAMKKGAVDFLPKPFDDDQLLDAVNAAVLKAQQDRAEADELNQIRTKLDSLTAREREVFTYLVTGMLNKQIAYALSISERTVKAHRKEVLDKMGVVSIAELVRLTEKAGVKPADVSA